MKFPMQHLIFIGISGYEYPHTRVRCYNFARYLHDYFKISTKVLSFRDHIGKKFSEVDMWCLPDREKLKLTGKALIRLLANPCSAFYIQKLHYHSAAPLLLNRIGFNQYIFDYDDYDVDLTVAFNRPKLNRFFFKTTDFKEMLERVASGAYFCVAASHFLVDFLKQYNKHVCYVPTGVDTDLFKFTERRNLSEPVVFLWNGIVWGEEIFQSVLLALRCFKIVADRNSKARLRIVGGGQYMPNVEASIHRDFRSLADRIEIISWVHPNDMPAVLSNADVGLLPLFSETRWTQSKSPTKLFEYMATGLPVIAFKNGEVKYVIEHEKNGFLASTEEEFAEYMTRLLEEVDLRRQIGIEARKRIEHQFSLPFLTEKLYWYMETPKVK